MSEDFIPKTDGEQAEFNNAFAFLERMNKIEYFIESALMRWDVKEAYACLESYENELAFCFKDDDRNKIKELKNEIIEIFNRSPNMGRYQEHAGRRMMIGQREIGLSRTKIIELNQYLRSVKHKNGMTMPKRGDGKLF
tara:strand:- start:8074 stop:8487 length:414 start_codon:yes stop_codon:yes gene_type:complete